MLETKRRIRAAVYTRKSHEEGLEQEFNSLDAQREAGEAFVVPPLGYDIIDRKLVINEVEAKAVRHNRQAIHGAINRGRAV